jgi:hypothetical protein
MVVLDGHDRQRPALVVKAADGGIRKVQDLGNLLGDGREHGGRRRPTRDQRRHPPERRLLLRKPPQLAAILRAWLPEVARHAHRTKVAPMSPVVTVVNPEPVRQDPRPPQDCQSARLAHLTQRAASYACHAPAGAKQSSVRHGRKPTVDPVVGQVLLDDGEVDQRRRHRRPGQGEQHGMDLHQRRVGGGVVGR